VSPASRELIPTVQVYPTKDGPARRHPSVADQLRRLIFEAGVMLQAIEAGDSPTEHADQLARWGIRDRRRGGSVATRRAERDRLTAIAVVCLMANPDWSDRQVAAAVGVSATWIRSNSRVQSLRQMQAAEALSMRIRTRRNPRNTGPREIVNAFNPTR